MTRPLRVLLIEDSPDDAERLLATMADEGHRIVYERVEAEEEWRAAWARGPWDLIVADDDVPGLAAAAALASVRREDIGTPFVVVSAHMGEDEVNAALRAGANGVYAKDKLARLGASLGRLCADGDAHREWRAAERELRRSEERLRRLTDGMRDVAAFMMDDNGRIASWGLGAQRIFGYEEPEALGQPLAMLFPPEDVTAGVPQRGLARARAEGKAEDARWLVRKDGGRFFADALVTPLYDDEHRLQGFMMVARDATARRQAEEERERLFREAQRTNRLKDEFLTTLSHELRSPLNVIIGHAELMLADAGGDEAMRESLEAIHRNAYVQLRLIDDLLDVSRIISGKMTLAAGPVDVVAVVGEAASALRLAAQAKGISIHVSFGSDVGLVTGDAARLRQAVWNVLGNAIKFTPDGGRVDVGVRREGGRVEVVVSDNGKGMDPSFVPHVFDHFRQEDGTTSRAHGGLGLGLAIVRHIVEAHGGSVHASSAGLGMGSTFTLSLPVRAVATQGGAKAGARDGAGKAGRSAAPLRGVRVLVVDDEPDARLLVKTVLSRAGADVITAASTSETFDVLTWDEVDLLVCDIGMPDEDGFALIRNVREREGAGGAPRLPAIALTAFASMADRKRALAEGFDVFACKPIAPKSLIETAAQLLGREAP